MEGRDAYTQMMEDDWDTIESQPVEITDTSLYATSSLRMITLNLPKIRGTKTLVLRTINNAYHDREDAKKQYCGPFEQPMYIDVHPSHFGCTYEFRIIRENYDTKEIVEHLKLVVRSQRSPEEQLIHMNNICKLVDNNSKKFAYFYRDIDIIYHQDLIRPDNIVCGTLKPKQRAKSGHPTSIAFNRFPATYLNTSDKHNSYYGATRIDFYPNCIFDNESNLLLVDMHCYQRDDPNCAHYITLVIAKKDSVADRELLRLGAQPLNIADNPFLTYNSETGELKSATRLKLRQGQHIQNVVVVEVMVADKEVPVREQTLQTVPFIQRENHNPRANIDCKLCFATTELSDSIFA